MYAALLAVYTLADLVNQFAYSTKFYGKDAVCDGGLSALENAFWVLEQAGCKVNSNGTIQRKNLHDFMRVLRTMMENDNYEQKRKTSD